MIIRHKTRSGLRPSTRRKVNPIEDSMRRSSIDYLPGFGSLMAAGGGTMADSDATRDAGSDQTPTPETSAKPNSHKIIVWCTVIGTIVALASLIIAYTSSPSGQPSLDLNNMMYIDGKYRLYIFNRSENPARNLNVHLIVSSNNGRIDDVKPVPAIFFSDNATLVDFPAPYLNADDGQIRVCITSRANLGSTYWRFENRGSGTGGYGHALRLVDQGTSWFGGGVC
jgi:hypothetical protein